MTQVLSIAQLELREDLGILFLRWLRAANTEEFMEGYSAALEAGNPDKVHCWLFDTRRRGPATPEAEAWFFETYLPRLHASLTKPHHIAVLHTPGHFVHIRDVIGVEKFHKHNEGSLLTMEFFDSEQKAVEWLMACKEK